MHERIVAAMNARERSGAGPEHEAGSTGPGTDAGEPPTFAEGTTADDDDGPATGGMTDRTGNHGYLMKVMKEELMPLADECIQMAREEQPDLAGMLIVDLEIISDEDIGGVVDTVGPGSNNEVPNPALLECMSESILSLTLPRPPQGGRDPISLSMPVSTEEE